MFFWQVCGERKNGGAFVDNVDKPVHKYILGRLLAEPLWITL
jgi:hypothetical protein